MHVYVRIRGDTLHLKLGQMTKKKKINKLIKKQTINLVLAQKE